jgi:beta-lactamase regulating signal transducer with metallopeptidase domain
VQSVLSLVSISTAMETSWTFLLTYWLHSTVLLGGLTLWKVRTNRLLPERSQRNSASECRFWRAAILLPIATTAFQTLMLVPCPVVRWEAARPQSDEAAARPVLQEEVRYAVKHPEIEAELSSNEDSASNDPFGLSSLEEGALPSTSSEEASSEGRIVDEGIPVNAETNRDISSSQGEESGRSLGMIAFATPQILGALSLLGILGFALTWIAAHHRERHARPWPKDGKVAALLEELCVARVVRRSIALLISPHNREPASSGLLRWKIFLPEGIENRLTEEELRAVLAHELAHLVRGDVAWLWIGRFLGAAFAFQPLNRLARRRWSRAAEFACDQWALDQGVKPLTLARTLTALAELRLRPQPGLALSAGTSRQGHLSDRVERLLHRTESRGSRERRGASRLILAIVVIAVGALCCLLIPRIDFSQTPEPWSGPDSVVEASDLSDGDLATEIRSAMERESLSPMTADVVTDEVDYATDDELILLQGTLDILDDELSEIEISLYLMRVSIGEDFSEGSAGARCLETLERLSSRAGRIREQRDRLASLIERWDETRE